MKKRCLCCFCVVVMFILGMTGCGSKIPDLTEAQREEISAYAVQLLLKYDTNEKSRLVDLSMLEEEPEPTIAPQATPIPTKEPVGMDEVADTPVVEKGEAVVNGGDNIKGAFGLAESISLEYVDYQIIDGYEDNMMEGFAIEAGEGKKLLICNFVLMNNGAEKQKIDMLQDNINYILNVDGKTINCLVTMLSNDLTTYMGELDMDESKKVVIITECEEKVLTEGTKIYLEVQRDSTIATIQVK